MSSNPCYKIFFLILISWFPSKVISVDTLTATQSLTNGQILVSSDDVFQLGFFSRSSSNKWYLGIWYKNIVPTTYVWVANRDNPLRNSSRVLRISNQSIGLFDKSGNLVWSSNQTKATNPVAQLLNSGNFILKETDNDHFLWQSFDYPTDTLLPKMKLGWDLRTGFERHITSWKSTEDPSTGNISFKLDFNGFPEAFLWNQQVRKYRSGPWNGLRFSGLPEMKPIKGINFEFVVDREHEVSYFFDLENKSFLSRVIVSPNGRLQRFTWIPGKQIWSTFWYAPKDQCDNYRECGPFGICDPNASPVCRCLRGFEPKDPQAWSLRDGSSGCVRQTELQCSKDKFLLLKNMKLPETTTSFVDYNMTLEDCKAFCLTNCSCTAYANTKITGGAGCVTWTGDLIDIRQYAEGGQDLYARLNAADLGGKRKVSNAVIVILVVIGALFLGTSGWLLWRFSGRIKGPSDMVGDGSQVNGADLPMFNFNTVAVATNYFSEDSKLGQGGFGPVHKGKLPEGQEIAVKRLSGKSGQGLEEFKNEIILIAKLQHRNLVRLLGCCIQGEEKMLIYEYMPNNSLDVFLFDPAKQALLDWKKRFTIIEGIARGTLYLHRDSRLRIIHRDLKASNILLDEDMNPKISDFGMARIFGINQNEANTNRVVGTYGYMAPEYAMEGLFSVKSDVYSFGVLLLEIVSNRKNTSFRVVENSSLVEHAWNLWNEGKAMELIDSSIRDSCSQDQVLKCIHVGMLCVQDSATYRPTMESVMLMLESEAPTLPLPRQPTFTSMRRSVDGDHFMEANYDVSSNDLTVTMVVGR